MEWQDSATASRKAVERAPYQKSMVTPCENMLIRQDRKSRIRLRVAAHVSTDETMVLKFLEEERLTRLAMRRGPSWALSE